MSRNGARKRKNNVTKSQPATGPKKIQSMTGFARVDGTCHAKGEGGERVWRYAWELRSVNSRGLRYSLPDAFLSRKMEMELRKKIPHVITRGAVSISLQLRGETGEATAQLSTPRPVGSAKGDGCGAEAN